MNARLITREEFVAATGDEPRDDDLERANCDRVGQRGHYLCGWNAATNLPRWFA